MTNLFVNQEANNSQKQNQHLLLSLAMQQAFHVLQMPVLELSEWLRLEIEHNPLLELDLTQEKNKESLDTLTDHSTERSEHLDRATEEFEKKRKAYHESLLTYCPSLFEHLMNQVRLAFYTAEELSCAELIIGHLDSHGFLTTPLEEIVQGKDPLYLEKILSTIQTFDPPGIAACDVKNSLLLQLKLKHKQHTLAYRIIESHFEHFLNNRIPQIAKSLHVSYEQIKHAIDTDLLPLDIHPGMRFCQSYSSPVIPDIILNYTEEEWNIQINHTYLPHFRIADCYQHTLKEEQLQKEERLFVQRHLSNGKWLKKIVYRRQDTLRCIATYLIKTQNRFLRGEEKTLQPITLQEMAEALSMHESTITRAVANKHIACPQGLFLLRSFFTHGITCQNGQKVSNHTLRQLLCQMIDKEDKQEPLSDDAIASQFKKMGIPCARRTVAKYRDHLRIAPSARRRKWK